MKLNIRTSARVDVSGERCRRVAHARGFDRSGSKAEPHRALDGHGRVAAAGKKGLLVCWLDRITEWVSVRLWRKTVVGYQDAQGFHYGPHPGNKEHQAACD